MVINGILWTFKFCYIPKFIYFFFKKRIRCYLNCRGISKSRYTCTMTGAKLINSFSLVELSICHCPWQGKAALEGKGARGWITLGHIAHTKTGRRCKRDPQFVKIKYNFDMGWICTGFGSINLAVWICACSAPDLWDDDTVKGKSYKSKWIFGGESLTLGTFACVYLFIWLNNLTVINCTRVGVIREQTKSIIKIKGKKKRSFR